MLKIYRLRKSIIIFNVRHVVTRCKNLRKKRIEKLIKSGVIDITKVNKVENLLVNWVKIDELLCLGYVLHIIKLFSMIITVCYFFAMFFKVFLELERDFMCGEFFDLRTSDEQGDWFYSEYFMDYNYDKK